MRPESCTNVDPELIATLPAKIACRRTRRRAVKLYERLSMSHDSMMRPEIAVQRDALFILLIGRAW